MYLSSQNSNLRTDTRCQPDEMGISGSGLSQQADKLEMERSLRRLCGEKILSRRSGKWLD